MFELVIIPTLGGAIVTSSICSKYLNTKILSALPDTFILNSPLISPPAKNETNKIETQEEEKYFSKKDIQIYKRFRSDINNIINKLLKYNNSQAFIFLQSSLNKLSQNIPALKKIWGKNLNFIKKIDNISSIISKDFLQISLCCKFNLIEEVAKSINNWPIFKMKIKKIRYEIKDKIISPANEKMLYLLLADFAQIIKESPALKFSGNKKNNLQRVIDRLIKDFLTEGKFTQSQKMIGLLIINNFIDYDDLISSIIISSKNINNNKDIMSQLIQDRICNIVTADLGGYLLKHLTTIEKNIKSLENIIKIVRKKAHNEINKILLNNLLDLFAKLNLYAKQLTLLAIELHILNKNFYAAVASVKQVATSKEKLNNIYSFFETISKDSDNDIQFIINSITQLEIIKSKTQDTDSIEFINLLINSFNQIYDQHKTNNLAKDIDSLKNGRLKDFIERTLNIYLDLKQKENIDKISAIFEENKAKIINFPTKSQEEHPAKTASS